MEHVFEESTLTFQATIKRGKAKTQEVDVKFEQQGGAEQLEEGKVTLGVHGGVLGIGASKDKEATFVVRKLPKVKEGEESYTFKYWMESDGETYEGKEYTVWPRRIEVACFDKDDEAKALPWARLKITAEGGEAQTTVADREGKAVVRPMHTGALTFAGGSPFVFTKWKDGKDKGPKRECVIERKKWTATVRAPLPTDEAGKTEGKPFKWYVNETADQTASKGALVRVEVGPKDAKLALRFDEVFVRATFPKANSKRNDAPPALCTAEDVGTALTPKKTDAKPGVDDLVYEHTFKVAEDGGAVVFWLHLGVCGLDKCKLEVGVTDARSDDALHLETWRRIYYQTTKPEGLTPPALTDAVNGFKKVGILFEEYTDPNAEIKKTDETTSWFDGSIISTSSSGKVLVIGTHNIAKFKSKFVKKAEKKPAAHILYCHYQLDAETGAYGGTFTIDKGDQVSWPVGSGTKVRGWAMPGSQIDASALLFSKALHSGGDAIVEAKWKKKGSADALAEIPADHLKIDQANHGNYLHIKLPDAAKKWIDDAPDANSISVTVKVHWSKGWYAGWCTNGDRHNVIVGTSSAGQVSQTIIHEVGHAIGHTPQAALPGLEPDTGKPVHPWQYTGRDHSGSHCANGVSKTLYDDSAKSLNVKAALDAAVCAMFGSVTPTVHAEFCPVCEPMVKATVVAEVTK